MNRKSTLELIDFKKQSIKLASQRNEFAKQQTLEWNGQKS